MEGSPWRAPHGGLPMDDARSTQGWLHARGPPVYCAVALLCDARSDTSPPPPWPTALYFALFLPLSLLSPPSYPSPCSNGHARGLQVEQCCPNHHPLAVAFDQMSVRLSTLPWLPQLLVCALPHILCTTHLWTYPPIVL